MTSQPIIWLQNVLFFARNNEKMIEKIFLMAETFNAVPKHSLSKSAREYQFFLFVCFRVTRDYALALNLGIVSGRLMGSHGMLSIESGLAVYKANSILGTVLFLRPQNQEDFV